MFRVFAERRRDALAVTAVHLRLCLSLEVQDRRPELPSLCAAFLKAIKRYFIPILIPTSFHGNHSAMVQGIPLPPAAKRFFSPANM